MHELNHDMEDLFRRAAEGYPLKAASNWDSINTKLDSVLQEANKHTQPKKRRFIYLLLFLFLVGGTFTIVLISPPARNSARDYSTITIDNKKIPGQKADNIGGRQEQYPVINKKDQIDAGDTRQRQRGSATHGFYESGAKIYISVIGNSKKKNYEGNLIENKNADRPLMNDKRDFNQNLISRDIESNGFFQERQFLKKSIFYNDKLPDFSTRINGLASVAKPVTAHISINQTKNVKKPRFYYGITAGPAINSVKSFGHRWAVKGGLFAGLQINNKFSAETGLIFIKNYYEAKSDHFDEKGIAAMLTSGRQLNEVHGSNQMLEIPINFRYKFSPHSKSIYAGAGLTSHIMTRESNWYLTTINGNNEMLYGNYENKKLYFASAVTISAGYQAPIGKNASIRVEPYTQLPLKGIGIGKIKLMSTGLIISLSRTTQ